MKNLDFPITVHYYPLLLQIYLNRQPNPRKKLLVPCCLVPPNPKCYVCAAKPEVRMLKRM